MSELQERHGAIPHLLLPTGKGLLYSFLMFFLMLYILLSWVPRFSTVGEVPVSAALIPPLIFLLLLVLLKRSFRIHIPIASDRGVIAAIVTTSFFLSVLATLSVLRSPDAFLTTRVSYSHIAGLVIFLTFLLACVNQRRFANVFALMAVMGAFTSAISILSVNVGSLEFMIFRETGRTAALFKHPNQLGMVISSTAPLVVAWIYLRFGVVTAVLGAFLVFAGSVYSGSKTNLVLSAVAMAPVFFAISSTVKNRLLRAISVILFVGFVFLAIPLAINFVEIVSPRAHRLLFSFTSGRVDEIASLMSRFDIWAESIKLALNNPLLGVGAGQPIGMWPHSHNVVLDYFRTLGFPGLLLIVLQLLFVLGYVGKVLFQSRCLPANERLVVIALCWAIFIFILANQSSESFGPNTFPFYWILMGMLIAFRGLCLPRNFVKQG